MKIYKHEYLLIGQGKESFKAALGLQKPYRAGSVCETYWDNRATPLPPGIHCSVREEVGSSPQLRIQQPHRPDLCLAYTGEPLDELILGHQGLFGLPCSQPASSNGLFADTKLQSYEEWYQQTAETLCFQQGIVYFASNREGGWAFVGAEPQAVHLTLITPYPVLKGKILQALIKAAALPTVSAAVHAQQLMRKQVWWWGKDCPVNQPIAEQMPQLAGVELESKLAVTDDFSTTSWTLRETLQSGLLPGFTPYQDALWVRHSHDAVRYCKSKYKLLLQGAAYRFGKKSTLIPKGGETLPSSSTVMVRQEEKPAYSPIDSFATAQSIHTKIKKLGHIGDIYCHKRKFLLQSVCTGGGYHVLIDQSVALAHPERVLTQIEIECQWKKVPPYSSILDPLGTAIGEIEALTRTLCDLLPGLEPSQLTKRRWLKQVLAGEVDKSVD